MMRSLFTAASGMMAQQTVLDTVANNLANVNTPGFKKTRVEFQDLLYESLRPGSDGAQGSGASSSSGAGSSSASALDGAGTSARAPVQVGHGVRVAGTRRSLSPGNFEETGNKTDLAIDGQGFFKILLGNSDVAYTRDGTFRVDGSGKIVTLDGYTLCASGDGTAVLTVPQGAQDILVTGSGEVRTTTATGEASIVGTMGLVVFSNPAGLQAIGKNLFRKTASSGEPVGTACGANGAGTIMQGYIERSNVQVVEEMVNLIIVQRAYEMNVKCVQSSDEILSMTNNLVRR